MTMRVLHVCTEVYPALKTGGLADVTGALPQALAHLGCDTRMLVPGFPSFQSCLKEQRLVFELPPRFGAYAIRLYLGVMPDSGMKIYFIEAPGLFDRPGNPYTDAANHDYYDNYRRFMLLGWMAARVAEGLDTSWTPEVVHAHDWHAGLTPAYLKASEFWNKRKKLAGSVFTVHNLAYQGNFPAQVFGELDLPAHFTASRYFHHVLRETCTKKLKTLDNSGRLFKASTNSLFTASNFLKSLVPVFIQQTKFKSSCCSISWNCWWLEKLDI